MQLKHYDADSGQLEGAIAKKGFERSGVSIPARKGMAIAGLVILAVAVMAALLVSYQTIFLIYSIYTIFIFMAYLVLWTDGAWEEKEPKIEMKVWPHVTLIIPSFNSGHTIFKCVESCKKLEYSGTYDIMVIDDGSTDGSFEKLQGLEGIAVIRKEKNEGKSAALNSGIVRAKGEIVACIDSDTYPTPKTLEKAVKYFAEDPKVGASVLFINTTHPNNFIQAVQEIEYWISFGFFFKTVASIDGLYVTPGPMALYRKKMFEELGGFDEKNLTEDMEIALRMQRHGWKIRTCHSAVVHTEVPSTIPSLYRQRLRWFRGGIMNMLKYIDMLLNPKYGNFGLFVLPTTLGAGFFAALFMLWSIFNYGRALMNYVSPWIGKPDVAADALMLAPKIDPFLLDSAMLFGFISLVMWGYFVYKSFHISHAKMEKRHILPLLGMLYLYPIFTGLTFLSAYVHEFSARKYKW